MSKKKTQPATPPTVIALTLPNEGGMPRTGTLLVQRGELAQLSRFEYHGLAEVSEALKTALLALNALEKHPPKLGNASTEADLTEKSVETATTDASENEAEDDEEMEEMPFANTEASIAVTRSTIEPPDPLLADEATDQLEMF